MRKALPGCLGWERFLEAWKPCDLRPQGRRFATGPRGCCSSAMRSISRNLRASVISSQGYSMAKHHGHHRWALAGWQARPARARGALEICPRGPRRQVGPGLGSWLCPHRSLEPGSHAVSWVEYLSQLERVVSPPPSLRVHSHSPSSSSAKSSRGSWWPIGDRTKPRGSGLA